MSYDQCKRLVQYARKRDIMRWAAEGLNHELNGMRPEDQEALITDLRAQRKFMEAMRWRKRHKDDAVDAPMATAFNEIINNPSQGDTK